ncbi:phage major capsid protein [Paraglaciecola chathamensis]|uniref:phage major capsid protein n=1 Tax=Paraglaciecola chathamensis TaxID=368405 RepID=UPI003644036B
MTQKIRAEMQANFEDRVLIGRLVDYGSVDSYASVFERGAFAEDSGKEFNLDMNHVVTDVIAKFQAYEEEDGVYIKATPKDDYSYNRMKAEVEKGAGLSVMFNPLEAMEADGIVFYKRCSMVGGALTTTPSNKNAVVTYFREEQKEKETKQMSVNDLLMKELVEAKETIEKLRSENKAAEATGTGAEVKAISELASELLKSRESEKILGVAAVTPKTDDEKGAEFLKSRSAEIKYMAASMTSNPKEAWAAVLKERGITGLPAPSAILKRIQDAVNDEGSVLPFIRHEELPTLSVGGDSALSYGSGHASGTNKKDSTINLETRILTPQYVYKYLKMPKLTMNAKASDLAGALLNYVMNRLPDMVIAAVNRAIITGGVDGVAETQIYPVIGDAWAVNVGEKADAIALAESLVVATPKANAPVLVIHRNDLATIKFAKDKDGRYIFPVGVDNQTIANHFGFKALVQSVAVDAGTMVSLDGYVTNGSRGMEYEEGTILVENNKEYLLEMPISGSLEYKDTAAYGKIKAAEGGA